MKVLLNNFLNYQERLIVKAIQNKFLFINELRTLTDKEIEVINNNLLLTNNVNIAYQVHKELIDSLVAFYLKNQFTNHYEYLSGVFNLKEYYVCDILSSIPIDLIPNLIEELHITFLNSQFSFNNGKFLRNKSKHFLKENGAVYTLKSVTYEIVCKTIENAANSDINVKELKCLDFACGTGRFYFEAVNILHKKYSLDLKDIVCKNLYAIDIDYIALTILRCKVISLFQVIDVDIVNALKVNIINRNALIPNTSLIPEFENCINFSEDFSDVFNIGGFNVIFSNPPYNLLKVNNKKSTEPDINFINLQNKVKKEVQFFKTSGIYDFSIEGMLNYYQLSIEMILKMARKGGQIGIICPSSLFADLTSAKLRKHLLGFNKLKYIKYFPEASNLFENVTQSTVIFQIEKGGVTDRIQIELGNNNFFIDYNTIKSIFIKNQEIPLIDKTGWDILSKISKFKKIKDFKFLRNKRGELDLTLFKDCVTNDSSSSDFRLVRGNMISDKGIINKNNEFVLIDSFISKKSNDFKIYDFKKARLICQQISNIDLMNRLKFTFCDANDILANSCNYINSLRCFDDLKKLHFLLNSELLNWSFKVTSSNNHINNYELDELPIIDLDSINLDDFSQDYDSNNLFIYKLYGLNKLEIEYISATTSNIKQKELIEDEVTL